MRWGVLGAGNMASKLCEDLPYATGSAFAGVAARDPSRAAAFAERFGGTAFATYDELITAADVDVVYVATTNAHHLPHALKAIEAGKPVLVEKPFALNAHEARTIIDAARGNGVFVMEAMWMRLNPLIRRIVDLVVDGVIGEVRSVRAEWGLGRELEPDGRHLALANGGGALLDIGVYPVTLAHMLLGTPHSMSAMARLSDTGVDDTIALQWRYDDGRDAELWASFSAQAPGGAAVRGSGGCIQPIGRFHRPSGLVVTRGEHSETIDDPIAGLGTGFWPQIDEVARCLRAGLVESPFVPHADTIAIMELLDEARAIVGVRYPGE